MTNSPEYPTQYIPECLRDLEQWVCWKIILEEGQERKVPINPKSGAFASTTKPSTWTSFAQALQRFQTNDGLSGIGFVFTAEDPYAGIDLDRCLDETKAFLWGEEIVNDFSSYTEVSPSGRGVKLFLKASKPPRVGCQIDHVGPKGDGKIEVYDQARFFTLTGQRLQSVSATIEPCQSKMSAFCKRLWPARPKPSFGDSRSSMDPGDVKQRSITYLNAMPPAISGSGGHSQTYAAATALVHGFGIEPATSLVLLTDHYNPRCIPPWSDKELQHKVNQAATKPHDRPFGWLRDERPEAPIDDVDLSQFVVKPNVTDDDEPESLETSAAEDPGVLPDRLLRVPGFINEVMDHCLETAPYPNQIMAFCGALALQAMLAGRRVRDPGDNRTNLYLLGLAHSAAGKDWSRKLNVKILHSIGLADCIGERFASGEGIQDSPQMTPAMLFQTDEIDGLLQSINKSQDARHEQIMSTLLTMYSSANSVYPMRRKAGKELPGVINQPSLVILAPPFPITTTTHSRSGC